MENWRCLRAHLVVVSVCVCLVWLEYMFDTRACDLSVLNVESFKGV